MTELSEKRKRMVFAAVFLILLALSIDFWNWNASRPLILGMSFWVFWHIAIVLMIGVYYLFLSKYMWVD